MILVSNVIGSLVSNKENKQKFWLNASPFNLTINKYDRFLKNIEQTY